MKPILGANIEAAPGDLRLLGDLVLVRRLPNPEFAGLTIALPDQWITPKPGHAAERGIHLGEVLAVGPGDRKRRNPAERIEVGVKVKEKILYLRAPANDIWLRGEHLEVLHEEQHVLAVIE